MCEQAEEEAWLAWAADADARSSQSNESLPLALHRARNSLAAWRADGNFTPKPCRRSRSERGGGSEIEREVEREIVKTYFMSRELFLYIYSDRLTVDRHQL